MKEFPYLEEKGGLTSRPRGTSGAVCVDVWSSWAAVDWTLLNNAKVGVDAEAPSEQRCY